LTRRVEAWRREGTIARVGGRRLWVRRTDGGGTSGDRQAGDGPLLLFLHGFPSSSYDWRPLLELVELEWPNPTIAFDFLGFGLSEKPRRHRYSLFEQAGLTERIVGKPGVPVVAIGHDMGTSVATELMARDLEGKLGFELAGVLLFNGSMVVERASLTVAQKLLRSPLAPLVARLTSEPFFRRQFAALFSEDHPLSAEEAADQWSLICAGGGRTLGHRLISYVSERTEHAERWHGALRDWPGELRLAWGLRDPVATTSVLEAVRELRPAAPVDELPALGHYPQLESPARILASLHRLLASLRE
jgi:pimeloyl-ACP methyl ester carboxylesterase